jgi:hypothetical protein
MGTVLIVLFGILLPAVTLGIELNTGMCAESFFDPIATLGHTLLVAFVPLANLLALVGSSYNWIKWRTPLLWANGIAMGIAVVYILAFLPITPIAVIAIIAMGMGFLPLAPLCSLVCAVVLRKRLLNMQEPNSTGKEIAPAANAFSSPASLLVGGIVGILMVLLAESTIVATLIAAEMTKSESLAQRVRGLNLLRRFGDQDEMLRMCYRDAGARIGDFGFRAGKSQAMSGLFFPGLSRIDAQRLFFCVTGQPYNSLPPPRGVNRWINNEFDFDPDLGGQHVAGMRKGLSLGGSRMDVQILQDAAVGYLEWTLVFQNDYQQQREARAQILLPSKAVVSRVTLWVNGEPCEAAFAGSGQVREAYQKVAVQQRRDPLLITWAGPDRVMAQCFPVPPKGEMKIRIGITAPLLQYGDETAVLRLPCFAERNFNIADRKIHSLWVESDCPYKSFPSRLHDEKSDDAKHALRGTLSDNEISSTDAKIEIAHSPVSSESWTPDPKDSAKYIMQKLLAAQMPAKRQIFLVIDGSAGMAEKLDEITESLVGLPKDTDLRVLIASDEVIDISYAAADLSAKGASKIAQRLHAVAGMGGCDNLPALMQAFEGSVKGDKTIIWIHAAQPVLLSSPMPLIHWMDRDSQVALYDFSATNGSNCLAEELKNVRGLQMVTRLGTLTEDLTGLLMRLTGQAKQYAFEWNRLEGRLPSTPQSSSQLVQLWAADQVVALSRSGKTLDRAEAVKLAGTYRIVTPVSGAVVLENRQQYKDSNLEPPVDESTVQTPEPAAFILLLTALPVFLWLMRRYKEHIK